MKLPMSVLASAIGQVLGLPLSPTHASMGGGVPAWTPALWFLANEQGVWYDPSDFTRYMGELGPEEIVDPGFNDPTKWTTNASWTVSGGKATHNGSVADYIYTAIEAPTVGEWYEATVVVSQFAAGSALSVYLGQSPAVGSATGVGTFKFVGKSPGTGMKYAMRASNATGLTTVVESFSVKKLTSINTATMFQDSAGTTPVTAVEQPVGLVLDKRLGLVRGPEIIPTDATWIKIGATATVTQLAYNSFRVQAPDTGYARCAIPIPFVVGDFYEIDFTVTSASGLGVRLDSLTGVDYLANGRRKTIARASGAAGTSFISFYAHTNTDSTVVIHSFRKLPGNHAYQTTAASRPVLSARKNLLTYSEDFTNGVWLKGANAAVTGNTIAAPNGSMTADTYTSSGAADALYATVTGLGANAPGAVLIRVKQGTGRWLKLEVGSNGYRCWIDTQTSTVGESATFGAGGTLINASVTPLADGWMDVKLAGTIPGTTAYVQLNSVTGNSSTTQASGTYYVWGAHYETGSSNVAAYQRVTTATDYDTVGFPHYLKFDGVDDFLSTGNIDFTATDKMTVMAALTKLADNNGLVVELGTNAATVDGTFSMMAGGGSTASYQLELRGTAACGYRAPSPAAPDTSVVTGLLDIAGADRTTEVIPRIDGVLAGAPTGGALGPAGTGNFISAPLYIGRRAGTSQPFSGNLNQLVVRGAATTPADILIGEKFVADKTGVTLP